MTEEFKDFVKNTRNSIQNGAIRVDGTLSDFDLAIIFALGQLYYEENQDIITLEELWCAICGKSNPNKSEREELKKNVLRLFDILATVEYETIEKGKKVEQIIQGTVWLGRLETTIVNRKIVDDYISLGGNRNSLIGSPIPIYTHDLLRRKEG